MENEEEYKGIGGWLILVGIGIIVGPVRLFVDIISAYQPIFENGTWEALTTVSSEAYSPLWAPILIGDILYNSMMVIALVYLAFLFFTRHYRFPLVYIVLAVISLLYFPLNVWLVELAMPSVSMIDHQIINDFLRVLIVVVIWVPYMLVSKRVKATFVEKRPNKSSQNNVNEVA